MRSFLVLAPLMALLVSDSILAGSLWSRSYSTGGSCSGSSEFSCVDSNTLSRCVNGKVISFACPPGTGCSKGYCGNALSSSSSPSPSSPSSSSDASCDEDGTKAENGSVPQEDDNHGEEAEEEDTDGSTTYSTAPSNPIPSKTSSEEYPSTNDEDEGEDANGDENESQDTIDDQQQPEYSDDNAQEEEESSPSSQSPPSQQPSHTPRTANSESQTSPSDSVDSSDSSEGGSGDYKEGSSTVQGIQCGLSEFSSALTKAGYSAASPTKYAAFIAESITAGGITSKRELAMFLAQMIWESGGLVYLREIACAETGCPGQYSSADDAPGKTYYGRGYIQLSWSANYKECSQDLYGDDRLWSNPDQVATNEKIAWATAAWYWKKHVHAAALTGAFGSTTMKINGDIECGKGTSTNAVKRFAIYQAVYKAFGLSGSPDPSGCY
ncbi:MAG: lysozyme-like domain-containing protein [Piptocephalis tieghemiana]|nr:MAG: lysozyme-like domain-containing protein [Piptocephalis tieghemiana]